MLCTGWRIDILLWRWVGSWGMCDKAIGLACASEIYAGFLRYYGMRRLLGCSNASPPGKFRSSPTISHGVLQKTIA